MKKKSKKKNFKRKRKNLVKKKIKRKTFKKRSKTRRKSSKKKKSKRLKKTRTIKKTKFKTSRGIREIVIGLIRFGDKFKFSNKINFNIDKSLQSFFQGISNKIEIIKEVVQEEKDRKKKIKNQKNATRKNRSPKTIKI